VAERIGQFFKSPISALAKRTFDTATERLLSFPGTSSEILVYHSVPHSRSIFSGTRKPDTEIQDVVKVDNSDIKSDVLDARVVYTSVL